MFTVRSHASPLTRSGSPRRRSPVRSAGLTIVALLVVGLLGATPAGATPAGTSTAAPDPSAAVPAEPPSPAPSTADEQHRSALRSDDALSGDALTSRAPEATAAAAPTDAMTAVTAARILDTRTGLGARGPVGAGRSVTVKVVGLGGVPTTGVSSVVLTVTVPGPSTSGTVTASASGAAASTIPSLRFAAGTGVTTQIWVPVGADGAITLRNDSTAPIALLADSVGYAGTGDGPGSYVPVAPARLLDSKLGLGTRGPVATGASVDVPVAGKAGVPSGATAALVQVTVIDPSAGGWLTARPAGSPPVVSPSSQLNWPAGGSTSGQLLVPLSAAGALTVYNRGGAGITLQVDVLGYVRGGSAVAGSLVAVPATRIVDSRNGLRWPVPRGPLAPSTGITLKVAGVGGIPASGVSAVLLQVVAINPRGAGNLLATQDFSAGPAGIAVKFGANQTRSSSVLVPVNSNGTVVIANPGGSAAADVAVDALGYVAAPTTEPAMKWSAATPTGSGLSGVVALDCASATSCLALDSQGRSATFTGSTWSPVTGAAQPTFSTGVSCGSATSCLATFGTNGIRQFTGTGWTALTSPTSDFLSDVSCWAADGCVVVAGVTGRAWSWNGTAFTALPTVFTAVGTDDPTAPYARSLSCTGPSFCAAVGSGSPAGWLWNGKAWSEAPLVPYGNATSVDCATTTFCTSASADIGAMVTYRAGAYQQDDVLWSAPVQSVSCPDATFCVGVSDGSELALWDGSTWTNPAFPPTVTGSPAVVSCPTRQLCVALQRDGQQVIGRR